MSRIDRSRVVAGDSIDATELNDTYDDYTQTAALDGDNTREQAFDLPHFTNVSIVKDTGTALLGNVGLSHTGTTTSVASSTSTPVLHPVQNNAGTETFLDFSSDPWVIANTDVLRVWWNLSVLTEYTGSPWDGLSARGRYTIPNTTSGTQVLTDGMHCWLAYLEWDITSAALTDFEPVTDQSAPTNTIDGNTGQFVSDMNASSIISPWMVHSFAFATEGKMGNAGSGISHGWHAAQGMWCNAPASQTTVYAIRLVITGLLHPAHESTGNNRNALIYDYNVAATLKYLGGRLSALQMTKG